MIRNGLFWADNFERMFIPGIEALAECLGRRILPSFANLKEEADRVEQEEYERWGASAGLEFDPSQAAEAAREAALSHYQIMKGVEQGVLNMFAAMCYHLFEQQLLLFHRRELLRPEEENSAPLLKLGEVKRRLVEHGIDITRFSVWAKIDELHLVANVVKHAEGGSADTLRARNSELFIRPDPVIRSIFGHRIEPSGWLYQPLMGEDFYVTLEIFQSYTKAVTDFWEELATVLRGQQSGSPRPRLPPRH